MSEKIRWGIIGPGSIAKAFRDGVAGSTHGVLAAIATRDPSKPSLATDFPGVRVVHGYDALLADKDIDAVMAAQSDLVEPLARFEPRLVKMTPSGEPPED